MNSSQRPMSENKRNKQQNITSNNVLQLNILSTFNNRSVSKKIKVRDGPNKDVDNNIIEIPPWFWAVVSSVVFIVRLPNNRWKALILATVLFFFLFYFSTHEVAEWLHSKSYQILVSRLNLINSCRRLIDPSLQLYRSQKVCNFDGIFDFFIAVKSSCSKLSKIYNNFRSASGKIVSNETWINDNHKSRWIRNWK